MYENVLYCQVPFFLSTQRSPLEDSPDDHTLWHFPFLHTLEQLDFSSKGFFFLDFFLIQFGLNNQTIASAYPEKSLLFTCNLYESQCYTLLFFSCGKKRKIHFLFSILMLINVKSKQADLIQQFSLLYNVSPQLLFISH